MSRRSLSDVGKAAIAWQKLLTQAKMARIDYIDKFREHTGGERVGVTDPGFSAAKLATDAEFKAWRRAQADERNALRRLERATRSCEQ